MLNIRTQHRVINLVLYPLQFCVQLVRQRGYTCLICAPHLRKGVIAKPYSDSHAHCVQYQYKNQK